MKPNDFILNTDYLSLAQTDKRTLSVFFAPETFSGGTAHNRTQDYTIPRTQGAIDRILISHNGGSFKVGDRLVISTAPNLAYINVYRTNPSTIRVRRHVYTSQSSYSLPTQNIQIKLASFKPPNVY